MMFKRFWEIDALRGMAIIMMIIFHFFFDLNFLGFFKVELYEGAWLIFQRITISLFLLLVGVSLYLKYTKLKNKDFQNLFQEYLPRAFLLGVVALGITLATWLYLPEGFVIFGIIHLIALAMVVAIPFLRFYRLNLLLGVALLAVGIFAPLEKINSESLIWLGFTYPGFYSVDYSPLIPWFGLVLIGLFLGKYFYPEGKRKIRMAETKSYVATVLMLMGRNSLLIYVIHQPILIGLLMLISYFLQ